MLFNTNFTAHPPPSPGGSADYSKHISASGTDTFHSLRSTGSPVPVFEIHGLYRKWKLRGQWGV